MSDKNKKINLSEKQKQALTAYGKWRPRLGRGAKWAGSAGLLSGLAVNASKNKSLAGKIAIPLTAAAGAAGIADKMLEEKVEKNRKMKKLTGDAFEKQSSFDPDNYNAGREPSESVHGSIMDRPSYGTLTRGAEAANVTSNEDLVEKLFSRKGRLAANASEQLKELWPKSDPAGFSRTVTLPAGSAQPYREVKKTFEGA